MDIDISDILADVSKPSQQRQSAPNLDEQLTGHHQPQRYASDNDVFGPLYDGQTAQTDHQLLVRAWTAERCCPELLPYPGGLIDRTMSRIRAQITKIEDLTSGVGDNNAGSGSGSSGQNANLILSILQTDLSRTQFLMRSYLRQRLAKITKFAVYYLTRHVDQDSKTTSKILSAAEIQFLRSHQALLSEFYDESFLRSFPVGLRRLDDSSGGVNMVEGPDGGGGVVVRCLAETWSNEADLGNDGGDTPEEKIEEDMKATVELRMRRGEIWVVRWRDVRLGVVKGDLEVL